MNTKALFPCGGGSNLILGTGTENQIFILRTPATIKFFHQILKKMMRGDPFCRHTAMWLFHFKFECYIIPVKNSYMNINVNLPLYLILLVDPSIYI